MQLELPFKVEPPAPPKGRTRHIQLGGRVVFYTFRRARRRTIGIEIDEQGLQASAPRWVTLTEVEAFIREKQAWVLRKLHEARVNARAPFVWREGARLPYLGAEVGVFSAPNGTPTRLVGDRLELAVAAGTLRDSALGWLRERALMLFGERVDALAPGMEVGVRRLSLSNARTQWGSCSTDGGVRLSWRLIHLRLALIDYVVAHELAHLRHMNHSVRFWRAVEGVFPDYRAARRELRALSHSLPEL
jgi:predicted metal-dependent hydrolase